MPQLHTQNLSLGYMEHLIVPDLSLTVPQGRITALVGANGSGKSTILKALARILKPRSGAAYLDGKAIHHLSTKQVARELAILPQNPEAPDGLSVRELVSYGRFPHQRGLGGLTGADYKAIDEALFLTGMTIFAERPVGNGSARGSPWRSRRAPRCCS